MNLLLDTCVWGGVLAVALYKPFTMIQAKVGGSASKLTQAGAIFAGLHWFGFGIREFALLNVVLSLAWLAVAWQCLGATRSGLDGTHCNSCNCPSAWQPAMIFAFS